MALEKSIEEASISSRSMLLQRFNGFYDYLCLLGEHINLLHNNLDRIENTLNEIRDKHKSTIESDKTELIQIRELMVTKTEVESLLQELNDIIKKAFPELKTIPSL